MNNKNIVNTKQQEKEMNHFYLESLKKEIENKKKKVEVARNEKIIEENIINEKIKKEIDLNKQRNDEEKLKHKGYMNFINEQIKEKAIIKFNDNNKKKQPDCSLFDINCSTDKRHQYKQRLIYNSISYNKDKSTINHDESSRELGQHKMKEKIISNKFDINLLSSNKYIYFKNKELSHSGQYPYSNSESMISDLITKYQINCNKPKIEKSLDNHLKVNFSSASIKPITYENAFNDYQIMIKYKKKQDQLLTKHMLDEQIKNKRNLLPIKQLNDHYNNSIFINPLKDYTHNKYINQLRVNEGIAS